MSFSVLKSAYIAIFRLFVHFVARLLFPNQDPNDDEAAQLAAFQLLSNQARRGRLCAQPLPSRNRCVGLQPLLCLKLFSVIRKVKLNFNMSAVQ
jgi:hypothetical protein